MKNFLKNFFPGREDTIYLFGSGNLYNMLCFAPKKDFFVPRAAFDFLRGMVYNMEKAPREANRMTDREMPELILAKVTPLETQTGAQEAAAEKLREDVGHYNMILENMVEKCVQTMGGVYSLTRSVLTGLISTP